MRAYSTTKEDIVHRTETTTTPPLPTFSEQGLPPGAIPVDEAGLLPPSQQEDTVSMRLEAEKFKFRIWRTLAGYVHKEIDGQDYLVPSAHIEGVLNAEGAALLCHQLEYWVNQVVGLGHTSYDEALLLWGEMVDSLVLLLTTDDKYASMGTAHKKAVMSGFKTLIWHQATRAVDGREAKNLITRIEEQRGENRIEQRLSANKGFKFPGSSDSGGMQ